MATKACGSKPLELEALKKPVSGEKLGSESDRWNIRLS